MRTNTLDASDLFVLLERAFRRRSRECRGCGFSLPFRMPAQGGPNWSVIPSQSCSPECKLILDDLVNEFQSSYRLASSTRV